MGNSPAMYAAHKDHARKAYLAERALALFEASASRPAVGEYYAAREEVAWSLIPEDRYLADDPAVNGDYEDPFADLAEEAEVYEADDRARTYQQDR
jgi:hypothetical protein